MVDDERPTAEIVRARLEALRTRLGNVEIVAVTKGFGPWALELAVDAGCDAIGENYAQELLAKREAIERLAPEVHFIGQLQSNKVRQIAGLVDVWETVDRTSLVDELAKRAPGARLLVQVDTTGQPGKGGCAPEDVADLVSAARGAGLVPLGLMAVGPTGAPPDAAREGFRIVRSLVDSLGLEICSMGMSADADVAVEEGSTQIRVGTALFGPRPPRI